MPPNTGEHSRTRSSTEIPALPASSYQLLYEFERRLDEKMRESRAQTKEDIETAVKVGLAPVFPRLDNIDKRLDEGNDRFAAQDQRAKEHSDRIDNAVELAKKYRETHPMPALRREEGTTATEKKKGKSMPWWLPLLIGGALAFLGERATKVLINSLADQPQVVVQPPAQPPTVTAPRQGGP